MSSYSFKQIEGRDVYTSTMAYALFELDRAFFPTSWTLDSWHNLFDGHERSLALVYEGQVIIGFALFNLVRADSFAHLLKILINPHYRGQGIAGRLLNGELDRLKSISIEHFFLEVEEENYAAQKLYQSCGFKVIHKKKDFYGQGRAALIMTLDLP